MKQRIISAAVGLTLLFVVLFFYNTIIFNIALALTSIIGVYEILKTVGLLSQKTMSVVCMAFGGAAPFLKMENSPDLRSIATLLYVLIVFTILLGTHSNIHISSLAVAIMATLGISFALANFVYIRDDFCDTSFYYIILAFALAWICDGGAYFVGSKFGKHKMSPKISPNKTVEGAVGGVLTNIVVAFILTIVYANILNINLHNIDILNLVILTLLCSLIGMLGDLSASIIKRQYNIKDFGNLIPGHGGVVDRFDSVFFVAPCIFMYINYFPIFI